MTDIAKILFLSLCVSVLFLESSSHGQGAQQVDPKVSVPVDKTSEVIKLQAILKKQQFLSVQFTQTTVRALRPNRPRKTRGKAFFANPNRFVWSQEKPIREQLIYDGSSLVQHRPDAKVATRFGKSGNVRLREVEEVVAMVLKPESLLSRYSIKNLTEDPTSIQVVFEPREQSQIQEIQLKVRQTDKAVSAVQLRYSNGNLWSVQFTDISFAQLDDKLFKFRPVPGTNITDL